MTITLLAQKTEINPDCVQKLVNPPTGKGGSEAAGRKAENVLVCLPSSEDFLSKVQQQKVEPRFFLGKDSGISPTQVFLVNGR